MPYSNFCCRFLIIANCLLLLGCAHLSSPLVTHAQKKEPGQQMFVIKNVNVISMALGDDIIADANVLITNERITSINGTIPTGATVIDGRGKWLVPGLIDMHVHVPTDIHFGSKYTTQGATIFFDTQDVMTPYIANGVTTIFDLNSKAEHFGQRNEIAKGKVIGPRMALAALIN